MIYLDSAATSLHRPEEVTQALVYALTHMGNSGRGSHEAALETARTIYQARKTIGEFFWHHDPSRVIFTANITQSLNMVINGLFTEADHVITTCLDHNSVLRPLYRLQEKGMDLTILPCDEKGRLCEAALSQAMRPNTRAVVCTHASNLTGNLVAIEAIGRFCHEHGLYLIVDSAQTAGVWPIDMEKQSIDILCFTGHKGLLGPQGTGGLCIREGIDLKSFCVGGSGVQSYLKSQPEALPEHLEAGTLNGHGIAGLLAGVKWLQKTGLETVRCRELSLMRRFYEGVRGVPQLKFYGDYETANRTAVVCLNVLEKNGDHGTLTPVDAGEIADRLAQEYDIAVRGGAHCAPLMHKALQTEASGAVRVSFSYFNTEAEIDQAILAIKEIAEDYV